MKKVLSIAVTLVMVLSLFNFTKVSGQKQMNFSSNAAPANEGRIARTLIQEGKLSKNATQDQIDKAVQDYLKQKLATNNVDEQKEEQKLLEESIKANGNSNLNYDNLIHGRMFGKGPGETTGVQETQWNGTVKKAKLLILLAEFSDDEYGSGPVHNKIEAPSKENNTDMWVKDFSTDHYNKMLFTKGGYDAIDKDGKTLHLDSMVDYYLQESGGSFEVDGKAFGWFKVPHSEAYYGDDNPNGGHDNLKPGVNKDLVKDVLVEAQKAGVNFNDYDVEDPYDLDKDGDFYEPDGIIDRLVIVHAGVDQSGGGGLQGANALWAHSSSIGIWNIPGTSMNAYRYIMQGEDGTIGVFCHEFGHNLGLPDEYDTIYSGNDASTGFFSLMGSGSWTGYPLGSNPTPLSPYARMRLQNTYGGNWYNVKEVNYEDISKSSTNILLNQSTSRGTNPDAVRVNLPQQKVNTVAPFEGSYEWYSGKADNLNNTLTTTLNLPQSPSASLDYMINYSTEKTYDFGYVEASTDGTNWTQLKKFDGSSGGWINEKVDLSAYAGNAVQLRFRYYTDGGTVENGIFLDNIKVTAGDQTLLSDDVESANNLWTVKGWTRNQGFELKNHYYLIEWRSFNKTGDSNEYCYNYVDSNIGIAQFYRLEPGMVIWYVNEAYTDNWAGVHPGYGYLTVVDAHPQPMIMQGKDVRSRLSTRDAAFNYERVPDVTFTIGEKTLTYQGKQAVPIFNDAETFWYSAAPSSGVKVPTYGIKIKVTGQAKDMSTGKIAIYK